MKLRIEGDLCVGQKRLFLKFIGDPFYETKFMNLSPIKLYKYLPAEYALMCIETAELKVSTIDTMNDPFELSPNYTVSDPSDPIKRERAKYAAASLDDAMRDYGIICMSGGTEDPVLWSHYADAHTGIVIEFVHPNDDSLFKVNYSNERPSIHADEMLDNDEAITLFHKELVKRKAKNWGYENEYRMFIKLSNCIARKGLYFYPISDDIVLRIVLGAMCKMSESYIQHVLAQKKWHAVEVIRARLSNEHFTVEV